MTEKKEPKKLSKKDEKTFQEIFQELQGMSDVLHDRSTPLPSREFALMLTKIEEAEMWAQRAFEVLGYEPEEDDEDEEGDDEEEDDEEKEAEEK